MSVDLPFPKRSRTGPDIVGVEGIDPVLHSCDVDDISCFSGNRHARHIQGLRVDLAHDVARGEKAKIIHVHAADVELGFLEIGARTNVVIVLGQNVDGHGDLPLPSFARLYRNTLQ
jgi:hypothetical protein